MAISVYGLAESNKIFEGLANTECSFLKFLDQVVNGEIKQSLPRWAGIEGINDILDGISAELNSMGGPESTFQRDFDGYISAKNTAKLNFEGKIQTIGNELLDTTTPSPSGYKTIYHTGPYDGTLKILDDNDKTVNGYYVLDVVKNFGKFANDEFTPKSTLYLWNREYGSVASVAETSVETAQESFDDLLSTSELTSLTTSLNDAKGILNDLKKPFDDVNSKIGGTLSDYSDKIDKYGKLVVKIVFSVLMVMNIALAVLMALIGLFSMKACVDCCCCRCICKSCVHILWNVLALMMILSFIVGSILALVGRIGGDLMSLASFIFSEDNFNGQNPLFLDKMDSDAQGYLRRCIIGDGNLAEQLNIGSQIGSLDQLTSIESDISDSLNEFNTIRSNCQTYNDIKGKLENMKAMSINFYLSSVDDQTPNLSFDEMIETLNNKIELSYPTNKDVYKREGTNEECPSNPGDNKQNLKILTCDPYSKYDDTITSNDINKYSKLVHDTLDLVDVTTNPSKANSLAKKVETLYDSYKTYLDKYIAILGFLQREIGRITRFINNYITSGESFSFLNGHFIQTNLKILLKYLKHSLGKDFYTVGVCLIVVGCSLILSVSSTILLIVIINIGLKEDMAAKNMQHTQSPGGVIVSEFQTNNNMKNMHPY